MRRREFITLIGSAAAAWPLGARAQQPKRRIGLLMSLVENDPEGQPRVRAFVDELQQLGWTDGRNVRIDIRWTAGSPADPGKYAAELVALTFCQRERGGVAADYPQRADRVCERH